ncbi:MAG TPA: hypothetical protein VMF88_07740 [Bacteroidota bacterium]|nr:hypothetical protein [Bacteroidota bacterium]
MRTTLAIVAGFFATTLITLATDHFFHVTNIYPPYGQPMFDTWLVLLALSYRSIFEVGGMYLTAVIAREKAKKAVWIAAIFGSVVWIFGGIIMSDYGPLWYSIAGAVTSIPLALLGLRLSESRRQNLVAPKIPVTKG